MELAWDDFPDAPASGAVICNVQDVRAGDILGLSLGDYPVLVSRQGDAVTVFVNACPHQFLPLDQRGSILSADATRLMCSNHHAEFDRSTGEGLVGEGLGCRLSIVPTTVSDGTIVVA